MRLSCDGFEDDGGPIERLLCGDLGESADRLVMGRSETAALLVRKHCGLRPLRSAIRRVSEDLAVLKREKDALLLARQATISKWVKIIADVDPQRAISGGVVVGIVIGFVTLMVLEPIIGISESVKSIVVLGVAATCAAGTNLCRNCGGYGAE
jgi:small-conductance mechanosensitive channel